MRAFSKTLLSLMVLAAFWYKADAPLFAQTSVQKLTPLPQPTMNLPDTHIGDNCSFMLPSGEPIFLCVTNRPLSSSTADTSIPQYEIKTYVYHLASPSSGVSWAAKPIESSWNQRNRGEVLRQVTGDGKILIWQGAGNWEPDGPVLLDDQGNQTTVPGIFHLGKNNVYQPVDLTKIEDPKFISTQDGGYILAFSEIQNSQKLWKVWELGVVSERLGGGQLTIIWEKTLPLNGNIDQVTFFQTSDDQTIVAYSETVKNKLKIQVINFGRLAQAAALRPIAVWQNTFEIPEADAEKLANKPLIQIQEDNSGHLLLSAPLSDTVTSGTYTQQCFWSLNIDQGKAEWAECKNHPYSAFHLDSQGHLWLAYPEKDNQQSHASKIMVEVLEPFQTSTKKIIFHHRIIEIPLPEGVAVNQDALFRRGIIWVRAILPATNQGTKIALLLSVDDNPAVEGSPLSEMLLIVNMDGYIEKASHLPWPSDKHYSSGTVYIPSRGFDLKIEPDQKHMWISGRYWWPFSTILLPGGNFRSQLFYVPLSK